MTFYKLQIFTSFHAQFFKKKGAKKVTDGTVASKTQTDGGKDVYLFITCQKQRNLKASHGFGKMRFATAVNDHIGWKSAKINDEERTSENVH